MSVLTIGSANPKFSWIISKNPATIRDSKEPFKKSIRKGMAYGWFESDSQSFRLWFKDHHLQSSFAEGRLAEFEYLDRTRYASPYLPISLITNCLATAFKEDQEDDNTMAWLATTVEIHSQSMLRHIETHFNQNGYGFVAEHMAGSAYDVTVIGPSVHKMLNAAMVIFLMFCVSTKDIYVNLKGDVVEKYIAAINKIDAPYFVRYLFKRNVFSNRDTFLKNKEMLDTPSIDLWHGDTLAQRKEAIFPLLDGGSQLIDIGCGELNYTIPLSSRYESVLAFEADDEVRENAIGKAKGRQIENVTFEGAATPEAIDNYESVFAGADVLITEVLEHIEKHEAANLLHSILKTDFNKLIVTVPNSDFNVNYLMEPGQFRHDDHKWEPNMDQFCTWLKHVVRGKERIDNVSWEVTGIGDKVNNVSTSIMAVFTKIKD